MNASLAIGRPAGIELRVHATFPLILLWAYARGRQMGGGPAGRAFLLLALALFLCVSLHELGHALVARRFGIGTRRIVLYPIGGVASLERMPTRPHQELLMSLGGPVVNLLIAGLLVLGLGGFPSVSDWTALPLSPRPWVAHLVLYNLGLAAFNLLPVFPMDGGRILRSLLAFLVPYAVATRVAAALGMSLALVLGIAGLFGRQPVMVLIAVAVFLLGRRENRAVQFAARLGRQTVAGIMRAPGPALAPGDPVSRCPELGAKEYAVLDGGRLVGVVPEEAWRRALRERGPDEPAHAVMSARMIAVSPRLPLLRLAALARETPQPLFPVVQQGELVGLVRREDLALRLQSAGGRRARRGWSLDLG